MLIDRTHRKWFFASAILLAVATAVYVVYANRMPNGPRGGSVVGLLFGILGSLMMTFAGLLAGRKQFPIAEIPIPLTGRRIRLGSAQFWLRGHIWLGLLSVPMILFHAGFAWGGLVENLLWITFGLVVLSGIYGLVVQQVFPRLLTARVPMETFIQQLPYQCTRTKIVSDRLVAQACGPLDVRDDPLFPVFAKISEFYHSAGKDDKGNWPDVVGDENRSLFLDLATYAKQSRLIRTEADFARFLEEVYAGLGPATGAAPAPAGEKPAAAKPGDKPAADKPAAPAKPAGGKPSPLEQMRAKARAAAGGDKPASPLERARAQAGGKPKAATGAPAAQTSPDDLETSEETEPPAATPGEKAAPASAPSGKPLSKLEQARAQAQGRKQSDAAPKPAEAPAPAAAPSSDKPLSKLEQARLQAAAKAGGTSSTASAAPATPVAVKDPPAEPPKPATKAAGPAGPAPASAASPSGNSDGQPMTPEQVEREVAAIRSLLKDQYGYDDAHADFAAEQPRRFLAPQTVKPAAPEIPRAKPPKSRRRAATMTMTMSLADLQDFVELACPFCDFEVQLRDRGLLGRAARCPNCREKFLLVEPEEPAEEEPEPAAADASPLERARAQGAARRAAAAGGEKSSPLERARAQAAAKTGGAAPTSAPGAKKSPLERAREQAAARQAAPSGPPASKGEPAAPARKTSPLDRARAQAAAGDPADAKPAGKPMPAATRKTPAPSPKPAPKPAPKKPGKAAAGPIPRTEELKAFYLGEVRPFLDHRSKVEGQLATTDQAGRLFSQMRVELPLELHPILGELEQNCEQRRQFAIEKRLHRWLHSWLIFHIPASAALFVLFVLHVVMALRVTPWAM